MQQAVPREACHCLGGWFEEEESLELMLAPLVVLELVPELVPLLVLLRDLVLMRELMRELMSFPMGCRTTLPFGRQPKPPLLEAVSP